MAGHYRKGSNMNEQKPEMRAHFRCNQCPRPVWREGGLMAAYDHWEKSHQYDPGMADYDVLARPVVAYEPTEAGR